MYKLHLEREVAISHLLSNHEGKCRFPHGHNLLIEVDIEAERLIEHGSSEGMIVDFGVVKRIIDQLDHQALNNFYCVGFPRIASQPTAERVATHLAITILDLGDNPFIEKITVRVHEARGQWAELSMTYSELERYREVITCT
jgi:6-pyruvoyl-tetrahydropterin synthase